MELQREFLAGREPRRTIATYNTYIEAQRAVDYLSDKQFPVERVAIVAEGLRFVEQVTGRMGYGQAILGSALSGLTTGAFFGFLFGLFNWIAPLISALNLALYGAIFGLIVGALIGLVAHALSGGQRDFASISGLQADRYNVMTDAAVADQAEQLLAGLGPAAPAR